MSNIPVGYLMTVLFLAWCTYFVVAPAHWPRALRSFGTFFEVINEVPFLALFWLMSATYLAFSEGDLAHPVGKLAFGLALLVVGGLVVIIYWGLQSAATVSRALDEGLGEGWQTLIPAKIQKQLQKKFTAKALLGPFFNRRFDVQRTANIRTQSDPGDIESFIELANKTTRKMKQNLVWGAGYNFIAIPIAAGLLTPIGITLGPAFGAVLMSLSTVIVAINAMLLKLDPK